MAAKGDKVFEGVMVCFTRASSCGPTGPPGGGGGGAMAVGQSTVCLTAVDSVGVTSDEINQLLE